MELELLDDSPIPWTTPERIGPDLGELPVNLRGPKKVSTGESNARQRKEPPR